nr:plexin domain-containing protein 1-like isoform X1 [Pocillopora verrucosa]
MFPLLLWLERRLVSLFRVLVLLATFDVSIRSRCQLQAGFPVDNNQEDSSLTRSTLPRKIEDFIKTREKREINVVSNTTIQDYHAYYAVEILHEGRHLWSDLSERAETVLDEHLSGNGLAVKNIELSFEFPYYGHIVTDVILTTGGFINLGTSNSRQIANFQYVAPLMAFFDPSLKNTSHVYHFDNGNEFIVQWSNVFLHDNPEAGGFTFQCMLNRTGEIVFSYHKIPIPVANISSVEHSVNIGISDAYYVDKLRHYYGIWQIFRTFYTYDAVHINKSFVANNTAIVLRPKKNCVGAKTCAECMEARKTTEFHCTWCSTLKQCSDGFDRYRSEWLGADCNKSDITRAENCAIQKEKQEQEREQESTSGLAPWLIAVFSACAIALVILGAWLVYALTHPNSRSGLCLIQCGPGRCFKKAPDRNENHSPTNSSVYNKVVF